MKPLLLLASTLLLSIISIAQKDKDIPAFGKIEKSELEMKECDFDKNAEAVVLFDAGAFNCYINNGGVFMELTRHVRIKILNDKGLDHANVHLRYSTYRNQQNIKNLSAQTYNLDASGNIVVTKLEKKLVYEKKISKRLSEDAFTFPEVKAGSVIEYKYVLDGAFMNDWYFQRSIPVMLSRYKVNFPANVEVYCQPLCTLPYETKKELHGQNYVQSYSMKNVPALRDEPYITSEDDYLQRLQTDVIAFTYNGTRHNYQRNWVQVVKGLMEDEDFGLQLKKDIPRTSDLEAALKPISDPYQRMTIIHNYVRKNMEWNGYSNIWAMEGVKSAWKDKKGTSGEINLILVNLLKDAGINAHPVLVSTRANGRVLTSLADEGQFDKVMAHVKIKDKVYVLDATDKYTPAKIVPYDVMFSEGLVIEKLDTYEWGWTTLWTETPNKNTIILLANIDEKGEMKGSASITSYDYARVRRTATLKEGKDKFISQYLAGQNINIDTLVIENEDIDSLPLTQRFKFSQPINSSGDYSYFSVNLFSGLEKNPFITDTRFSDVFFGTKQEYNIVGTFIIPTGYTFEELPKNIRMIMPDTSISIIRLASKQDNQVSVRLTLQFKKPFYGPDEYPDFKEFYKKLFDLLNEQIVIRKKATS
jgi:hypothetical protein